MSKRLKVDQVSSLFACRLCDQLLERPVALPCGVTVCERHLSDELAGLERCRFCQRDHSTVELAVNEQLSAMLAIQLNSLCFSPKFEACKAQIEKASSTVAEIDLMCRDPHKYVHEHFADLKLQVDLRREDLLVKMSNYSTSILEKIEAAQAKCLALADHIALEAKAETEAAKEQLSALVAQFDSFEINDDKYEAIALSLSALQPTLQKALNESKGALLEDNEYEFVFQDVSVATFGLFNMIHLKNSFMDSNLLDMRGATNLINLCEFSRHQKWKCIYQASADGFSSASFHDKCDGVTATLTIIKTTNGNIFGGYTDKPWNSKWQWVRDQNAFIFSLVNREASPFKAVCTAGSNNKAIYCEPECGPTFGDGDFCISSNSNQNQQSFSSGQSYVHPFYQRTNQSILAGSQFFRTVEIEVYRKVMAQELSE